MKISKNTLNVLKNFATIQNAIIIRQNTDFLITTRKGAPILANAPIDEVFPSDFSIYDINQFLRIVGIYKDPEFDFGVDAMTIRECDGTEETVLHYKPEELITEPPRREFVLPVVTLEVRMLREQYEKVAKSAQVMSLPDLRILAVDGVVSLQAYDKSNKNKNVFGVELGKYAGDKKLEAHLLIANMNIMAYDYDLSICFKEEIQAIEFKSIHDRPTRYWMTLETTSSYQ